MSTKNDSTVWEQCISIVESLPNEEKHGYWIENDNGTYSCSECQSWIPNEQHYYAKYCLFCGARMDGGENEHRRRNSKENHR